MKVITIGRAQGSNDVVVSDVKVSRHHLQLIIDDFGNVKVNDMGSTNGTFVNGTRIMGESPLFAGDQLRIGDTMLQWQSFVAAAQNAMPPAQPMPPVQPMPPQQPPMSPMPPKPRRTGLIIALSLLGVILTGAIVWLLLSGPKDDQNIKKEAQRRDSLRDAHNGDSIPGEAWDSDAAMKDFMDKYGGLLNATSDNDGTPHTFWTNRKPKQSGDTSSRGTVKQDLLFTNPSDNSNINNEQATEAIRQTINSSSTTSTNTKTTTSSTTTTPTQTNSSANTTKTPQKAGTTITPKPENKLNADKPQKPSAPTI